MLIKKQIIDQATGNIIQAIGNEGINTAYNYYTVASWYNDSCSIVVSTNIDRESCVGDYAVFNTMTQAAEVLVSGVIHKDGGMVDSKNNFYYYHGNKMLRISQASHSPEVICELEEGKTFNGVASITNDTRYIGLYWLDEKRGTNILGVFDTVSCKLEETVKPVFEPPYPIANHTMINPEDPDIMFFAHEGLTDHISDRIWFVNTNTGKAFKAYKQKKLEDGTLVEYVGHESWAYNGDKLYFVNYCHSPLKPTGIYCISKSGNERSFINGDYDYWHASPSNDGRWIVADTGPGGDWSKIVLIDLVTKQSRVLCENKRWLYHPGQPHPTFSPDSKKVSFTFADEKDYLWIGYIDLEHLQDN